MPRSVTGYTSNWNTSGGEIAVARHQRHHRRKIAAGRIAAHRDAPAIDAKRVRLRDHPSGRRGAVIHRGGELVFRRHAVIDRHHAALRRIRVMPACHIV